MNERYYVQLIMCVQPAVSHPGRACPGKAMSVIATVGRQEHPSSQILRDITSVPDDGRGCPSGEMYHTAKRWLEETA